MPETLPSSSPSITRQIKSPVEANQSRNDRHRLSLNFRKRPATTTELQTLEEKAKAGTTSSLQSPGGAAADAEGDTDNHDNHNNINSSTAASNAASSLHRLGRSRSKSMATAGGRSTATSKTTVSAVPDATVSGNAAPSSGPGSSPKSSRPPTQDRADHDRVEEETTSPRFQSYSISLSQSLSLSQSQSQSKSQSQSRSQTKSRSRSRPETSTRDRSISSSSHRPPTSHSSLHGKHDGGGGGSSSNSVAADASALFGNSVNNMKKRLSLLRMGRKNSKASVRVGGNLEEEE